MVMEIIDKLKPEADEKVIKLMANSKAVYYNKNGKECPEEEATHMVVYLYDERGRVTQTIRSEVERTK